jgi:hypothetical protein
MNTILLNVDILISLLINTFETIQAFMIQYSSELH